MAKVYRLPLPRPFWSLEFLELDALATNADGAMVDVKRLYLVDRRSSRGLRLLKSLPCVPATSGFPSSIADPNGNDLTKVTK